MVDPFRDAHQNHSFSCLQVAVGTRKRLPHQIFMAQCGFPLGGNQDRNDKGMAGGLVSCLAPAVVLVKHFSLKRFARFLPISMYRELRRRLPSPPTEISHLRCRLFFTSCPQGHSHELFARPSENCREACYISRLGNLSSEHLALGTFTRCPATRPSGAGLPPHFPNGGLCYCCLMHARWSNRSQIQKTFHFFQGIHAVERRIVC